jgi:hypothetical protein
VRLETRGLDRARPENAEGVGASDCRPDAAAWDHARAGSEGGLIQWLQRIGPNDPTLAWWGYAEARRRAALERRIWTPAVAWAIAGLERTGAIARHDAIRPPCAAAESVDPSLLSETVPSEVDAHLEALEPWVRRQPWPVIAQLLAADHPTERLAAAVCRHARVWRPRAIRALVDRGHSDALAANPAVATHREWSTPVVRVAHAALTAPRPGLLAGDPSAWPPAWLGLRTMRRLLAAGWRCPASLRTTFTSLPAQWTTAGEFVLPTCVLLLDERMPPLPKRTMRRVGRYVAQRREDDPSVLPLVRACYRIAHTDGPFWEGWVSVRYHEASTVLEHMLTAPTLATSARFRRSVVRIAGRFTGEAWRLPAPLFWSAVEWAVIERRRNIQIYGPELAAQLYSTRAIVSMMDAAPAEYRGRAPRPVLSALLDDTSPELRTYALTALVEAKRGEGR